MDEKRHSMQSMDVRRASIADNDKVRYRVYSSPTEFIAVIAENALLAVKVAGIKNPHKIVRDLPTEGGQIEAKKMDPRDDSQPRVAFNMEPREQATDRQTEMAEQPLERPSGFVPMGVADLQRKGERRARILSPEAVHEIIEEHARNTAPHAPMPPSEPVPPEVVPEAVTAPVAEETIIHPHQPSQAEKVETMADAVLPPSTSPTPIEGEVLSPDEVEKLLNG